MCPDDRGVHRDVPIDLTGRVRLSLELLEQALPRSVRGPQPVALVDRLPRAEPLGQVAPVHAGPHAVKDPVDHLPVVPSPATTPVADRQERSQPFPLGICQVTPRHTRTNDQDKRKSHDRPERTQVCHQRPRTTHLGRHRRRPRLGRRGRLHHRPCPSARCRGPAGESAGPALGHSWRAGVAGGPRPARRSLPGAEVRCLGGCPVSGAGDDEVVEGTHGGEQAVVPVVGAGLLVVHVEAVGPARDRFVHGAQAGAVAGGHQRPEFEASL